MAPNQPGDQSSKATERHVILVAVLASSLVFIDGSALNLALPALQEDLQASGLNLLAILNIYAVFLTSLLLLGGSLGDCYGRKRVMVIGISVFAVASLLCGVAPHVSFLIGARAFQGVGAALIVPGSLAIIADCVPIERRTQAIGIWSACTVVCSAAGPVLGGLLAQTGLWRGVFFINLPLALLAVVTLWRFVPEIRHVQSAAHLDYAGAGTATLGLLGVCYGLIESAAPNHDRLYVSVAMAVGISFLLAFLLIESRATRPLLPLGLFKLRSFVGANIITLFVYVGLHGMLLFLPLNLIQFQGYDASVAGLAQLPLVVVLTSLAPWAGKTADRVGPRPLLVAGSLTACAGFGCLAIPGLTKGPVDYWTHFFPAVALLGAGMGLLIPPLSATVVSSVEGSRSGLASGINSTIARLASVLAIPVLGVGGIIAFGESLNAGGAALHLPEEVRLALVGEAANLGDARVPATVDPASKREVETLIKLSFVHAFRVVALVSTFLAALAALTAAFLLRRHRGGYD